MSVLETGRATIGLGTQNERNEEQKYTRKVREAHKKMTLCYITNTNT